jgi:PBSX family phage terminase large subunit
MVAQVAERRADIRLVTEIRGMGGRLWTEHPTGEIIYSGPAGTGKTRTLLEYVHQRCQSNRERWLLLRKTEESLKTSALVTFREQVLYRFDGKRSVIDGVSYFGGSKLLPAQFTYETTGSVIVTGGLDNPEKVKSSEWDGVFVNEATELTLNEWELVTGRTDRPSLMDKPPAVVLGDCNPDSPTHWIKQRADSGKLQLWTSTHIDNPAMWDRVAQRWTPAGERYLKRLDEHTGVRYQRLRLGLWVSAEGQVYETWNPATHIIDRFPVPADWDHYWDIDFGYTHPFVWHDWVLDPDGRLYLIDEIYQTQILVEDHATNIMARTANRPKPKAIITDHDAEDRGTFERKTGLKTTAAKKNVSGGIQAVASRLRVQDDAKARLYVFRDACPLNERDRSLADAGKPTCTADEFSVYIWDTRQGARKGEQPLKENDHGMDSTRYQVVYHDGGQKRHDIAPVEMRQASTWRSS